MWYKPYQYGERIEMKDVAGQDVLMLDCSLKRHEMQHLMDVAKSVVVLDHHKTAQKELEGLQGCIFDMEKSGARLTQEWLGLGEKENWLVNYTEDRDLWRWRLPYSKEINSAIRSYSMAFEEWEALFLNKDIASLVSGGTAILRAETRIIESKVGQAWEVDWMGVGKVLVMNATDLISEIAGELAKGRPMGVCFFDKEDKRVVSLRSREGGIDVSEVAAKYGGGGHKQAAGFQQPIDYRWPR